MNELIKIEEKDGQKLVSARELHKGLEATERFSSWFQRYVIQYGFVENEDFIGCKVFNTLAKQELQDYAITVDVAKHVSMLQRNELGMKFRQYFIECEKQLNQISTRDQLLLGLFSKDPIVVKQCHEKLLELETAPLKQEIEVKTQTIEEQKPMVDFTNTVLKSKDNILVRQLAKIAQNEGLDLGERKLYNKLREWGMIFKNSTEPYQKYVTDGTFVVEEKPVETAYTTLLTKTTKVTPIGQVRIIQRLLKESKLNGGN